MKRKIKNHKLFLFILLFPYLAFSQESSNSISELLIRKNAVDLTFAGSGVFLSANYNRVLVAKPSFFVNGSIGIGVIPFDGGINLPQQLTINFGKKTSFLEIGIGGSFWINKSKPFLTVTKDSYKISPIIGWRKYFKNNLVFRIYAYPLVGEYFVSDNATMTSYEFKPSLGISLGYAF